MNAIEIRNLSKSFRGMYAVDHLNMTVPQGAIYGFIGENGSGKSTTEKLICGHLVPNGGEIKLFGKDYTDPGVRVRVGALIENAGCFPGSSVYQNLMMQCINLGIENPDEEIHRVLDRTHGGQRKSQIQELLARYEAAYRHCYGTFGRPRASHSRRADQRS